MKESYWYYQNQRRSWSGTLKEELELEWLWRRPPVPRKMGSPLRAPQGRLPQKGSEQKMLKAYFALKRLGKRVDEIEPLIAHLL
jgi:hypothetical protein